jgi:predicted nucleotidyltransferase
MITILKSGYEKIMRLFYDDKNTKLHLREIARRTKMFEPSVSRFLSGLEQESILKSEKDGNLKKYSIKRNMRTYFLFEAFDIEKFENLPNIRRKAIKTFLDNLQEKPIFAILFGSTAKGNYAAESDIDILLIANRKISAMRAENETTAMTAIKISTFQISYKEFLKELKMKDDKVVQSAISSGYPLINHINYYELILSD